MPKGIKHTFTEPHFDEEANEMTWECARCHKKYSKKAEKEECPAEGM